MSEYKIKFYEKENSFKIFANKEDHNKILNLLLSESKCFVKDHVSSTSQYLEIDNRAFLTLLRDGKNIGVEHSSKSDIDLAKIKKSATKENKLAQDLKNEEYDLTLRIWEELDKNGKRNFSCKVGKDIYSCSNYKDLIALMKGEYLIESKKPLLNLSSNPFKVFGIFDVISDALSSDKSMIKYNFKDNLPKKKFEPLVKNFENFRIVIDGADDTANAMNNTGLPQQTVALMQGLLIFPVFLQGVYLGYSGLSEEADETKKAYQEANFKKAEILVKLQNFRKEICKLCDINFDDFKEAKPLELMREVGKLLKKNPDNLELNQKIVALTGKYQKEVEKDIEAPEIKDVLAAYCGFAAMSAMTASVATYEAQALINIFGGVKNVTTANGEALSLFSQVGNIFGFAGQGLMAIFAFSQMVEEHKEWKEVEEELQQFLKATDVSDFAKKISEAMMCGKRDNHRTKTFGSAFLSIGQSAMAVGGPVAINLPPLLFIGLAATLGGIAVNSASDLKYQLSFNVNENFDKIENAILKTSPKFTAEDFSDINTALKKQAQRQIFALEILGHLRAPQWVLHEKHLEENKDQSGIIGRALAYLGGDKISKWLNKPPLHSVNLIKNDARISLDKNNPYDLDIFAVDESWLPKILKKADELIKNHESGLVDKDKTHQNIIQKFQEEFIKEKSSTKKIFKSATKICDEIIKQGGAAGDYLQEKIMRGIGNKNLKKYKGSLDSNLPEFTKNGEKITVGKLDLSNFFEGEKELENFLTKKRSQKTWSKLEKKSPLDKAYEKELHDKKSDHLRPFVEISKLSNLAAKTDIVGPSSASLLNILEEKSLNSNLNSSLNSNLNSKAEKSSHPSSKVLKPKSNSKNNISKSISIEAA